MKTSNAFQQDKNKIFNVKKHFLFYKLFREIQIEYFIFTLFNLEP